MKIHRQIIRFLCLFLVLCFSPFLQTHAEAQSEKLVTAVCTEQGFSTMVPSTCDAQFVEGSGLQISLGSPGYVPFVLVWRVNTAQYDAWAYLDERLTPRLQKQYGDNLIGVGQYEYYSTGGKELPANLYNYRTGSGVLNLLKLVEVRDDHAILYTAKFSNATREETLHVLDLAVRYYQPSVPGQTRVESEVSQQTATPMVPMDIQVDSMKLGRTMVPEGYTTLPRLNNCTQQVSLGNPLQFSLTAMAPDGEVIMYYASDADYIHILATDNWTGINRSHVNGQTDYTTLTPMLESMQADAYCDYAMQQLFGFTDWTVYGTRDFSKYQSQIEQLLQEKYNLIAPGLTAIGATVEHADMMFAQRGYTSTMNGTDYFATVCCLTFRIRYSVSMPGAYERVVLWDVPCLYAMVCPVTRTDFTLPIFELFMENTSVSDQFMQANRHASNEIRVNALKARSLTPFSGYCTDVLRSSTDTGEDYYEDRFSDYLFDQNEYTLSDGTQVKVSTSFEHVYEGDHSTVYVSTGSLTVPGGATELTPNR